MAWYQFLIRGENYLLKYDNGVKNLGWYTTRYVKAASVEEAEKKVDQVIRADETLEKTMVRTHALTPRFFFEEIYELDGTPPKKGIWPFRRIKTGGGFTFYNMNEEEE